MNKRIQILAVIGMLSIFLLGNFNTPTMATVSTTTTTDGTNALPSTINICGVFPISKRPDAGPDRRDAFLMAVDDINAQTGADRILPTGVTLNPIVQDDLNSADGGTAAANACVSANADIVIGSSGSTVSAAMAAVLTPLNIIQISYASSSPSLSDRSTYPYFMRNVASDADQSLAIADLVAAFGWTNGATINTDDSYGAGLISYFTGKFTQNGGTIVSAQTFTPGATDVSAQVQALSDANPQFVLLHAIDQDAKTVFKKAYELGIAGNTSDITWIITDGSASTATFAGDANVQAAMQNVIGTTPTPLTQSTYAAFNASWFSTTSCGSGSAVINPCAGSRTNAVPNSYAPFSYDAVFVAAKGMAAAGTVAHDTTNTDKLLTVLYNVTFTGASGTIKFNSKGELNGRYDFVTLNDTTYFTFGKWEGTSTFTQQQMTLSNGRNYELITNKYYLNGQVPSSSTSTSTSASDSISPGSTSTSTTSLPFNNAYFFFAIVLLIGLTFKRRRIK